MREPLALLIAAVAAANAQQPASLRVSAGKAHACVYASGYCAYCFGDNAKMQIGAHYNSASPELTRTPKIWNGVPGSVRSTGSNGLWPVDGFDTGGDTTCVTSGGSEMACWGEVDQAPPVISATPVAIGLAVMPVKVMSTSGVNACVVGAHTATLATCKGDFGSVLRPNGLHMQMTGVDIISPNAVDFVQVSAGFDHACALDANGDVWCAGHNRHGQCRTSGPEFVNTNAMVKFNAGYTARHVVASHQFTAILSHSGQLYLYGRDRYGGLFWSFPRSRLNCVKSPGSFWSTIDCGKGFCCGIRSNGGTAVAGSVQCFGYNNKQQAIPANGGTTITSTIFLTPTTVSFPTNLFGTSTSSMGNPMHVGTGDNFACAYFQYNGVACWGQPLPGFAGATPNKIYRIGFARCDKSTKKRDGNLGAVAGGGKHPSHALPVGILLAAFAVLVIGLYIRFIA